MKNTMEKMKRLFRENDASEKDAVKDESEKWHLFIGKTSEDKMGIFFQIFTHWVT